MILPGFLQGKRVGMLRNSKDMTVSWKRNVQPNTLWSSRLGVGVSTECLLPPSALILFIFAVRRVHLWSPVLQVQIALFIELNLRFAIPLELNVERCVADDCLERTSGAVKHLGKAFFRVGIESRRLAQVQTSNHSPFLRLIIPLLASLTIVPKIDLTLQSFLFVDDDSRSTGFEEGYREWKSNFFVLRSRLNDGSLQLRALELDRCRIEFVGGGPG